MRAAPYHDPDRLAKPESRDSVFLVEPRGSMESSIATHVDGTRREEPGDISLGLAIRRGRLVLFTLTMVAIVVVLTVVCYLGTELTRFDSRTKTTAQQTKLLNDYNSYSGNVASALAKPIELFVTVAVQVIVLRFMADAFTRPEMGWKISAVTLLIGALVGYLIGNGFNALNVQLRKKDIHPVMSLGDVSYQPLDGVWNATLQTSNSSYTRSERVSGNPLANTLLRTLIMPKIPNRFTGCEMGWEAYTNNSKIVTSSGLVDDVGESYLNLGFAPRDWQTRLLQKALPSDTFRLVVNPTNTSANMDADSSKLPMRASRAADLFYYGMWLGTSLFPWGARDAFVNRSDIINRYPVTDSKRHNFTERTAKVYGLLPPDNHSDEDSQKKWFARESVAAMSRQLQFANRTRRNDVSMEFTRTRISPTIAFDAVTFEFEMDPSLLATTSAAENKTRYTVLDQIYDCPVPKTCMVRKASYRVSEPMYDPPAQVIAYALCTNSTGQEMLLTNFSRQNDRLFDDVVACSSDDRENNRLNPSMLVISIGKRLVAESIEQNVTVESSGRKQDEDSVTITNLRKIYSFTVGRLAWNMTDLADAFNAECRVRAVCDEDCPKDNKPNCRGLEMALSPPLTNTTNIGANADQRLVVGWQYVRPDLLAVPSSLSLAKMNLVTLNEPPESSTSSDLYKILAGDVLLPHNIDRVSWNSDDTTYRMDCDAQVENRIAQALDNHLYMEHSLQTGYTAAVFFLFQYGSVRDSITIQGARTSLAFDENSQDIAVWLSTPLQNMVLTLSGCLVLILGLIGALVYTSYVSSKNKDVLANITAPQTIARVMVDERLYPPVFLRRHVVEQQNVGSADQFAIAAVALKPT